MKQIIFNYLWVFIIPALIGFLLRFFFRRAKKGSLITAALIALAVLSWIVATVIPSHGSELYAIRAMMVTSSSVAALMTDMVIRLNPNR
ncbi:MAG: hypothetical protein IKC03_01350 [Oscillospiraceae bacterium]|nr:hypothetical protein [Oscillospiraceae bacterium]